MDNIDLNQMSHQYVSGVFQNDWFRNDPWTSVHLIDRSEDAKFELVWVIKRSILLFPVYITLNNDKFVIDSAVLHWPTRLMVFPRNAGFGRCYLVSTRQRSQKLSHVCPSVWICIWRIRKNELETATLQTLRKQRKNRSYDLRKYLY